MSHFEDIYEIAADNNGIITSALARKMGVERSELSRWVRMGRLERMGQGVYLINHHVPTEVDPYALAVALVGSGAFLYGESVIAMHSLAPTNPSRIYVATPHRVRRSLPPGLRVVSPPADTHTVKYEGVASQRVYDALVSCMPTMLPDRLVAAVRMARREGLITLEEHDELVRRLEP